jgi:hypothetical protein
MSNRPKVRIADQPRTFPGGIPMMRLNDFASNYYQLHFVREFIL